MQMQKQGWLYLSVLGMAFLGAVFFFEFQFHNNTVTTSFGTRQVRKLIDVKFKTNAERDLLEIKIDSEATHEIEPSKNSDSNKCEWAIDALSPMCRNSSKEAIEIVAQQLRRGTKVPRKLAQMGESWGNHPLVDKRNFDTKCIFYSYGIARDLSFDKDLEKTWQCKGFLFDPSVVYPAKLTDSNMLFFSLGAPLLPGESQTDCFSDPNRRLCKNLGEWITVSPPQVMNFFGHKHLDVLKMDCEGCEYALARDVANIDPEFFAKVDQFAVEIHVSKFWIKGDLHLHYLGLLYHMLFTSGFVLVYDRIEGCALKHEKFGCPAELEAIGYPCGIGKSCHNYLFAKMALLN